MTHVFRCSSGCLVFPLFVCELPKKLSQNRHLTRGSHRGFKHVLMHSALGHRTPLKRYKTPQWVHESTGSRNNLKHAPITINTRCICHWSTGSCKTQKSTPISLNQFCIPREMSNPKGGGTGGAQISLNTSFNTDGLPLGSLPLLSPPAPMT